MWFCKKAPETVLCLACTGCGCLMWAARKEIEVRRTFGSLFDTGGTPYTSGNPYYTGTWTISSPPQYTTEPFCGRCAPPYDVKRLAGDKASYYRREPSRDVEVTEKGKAIKENPAPQ